MTWQGQLKAKILLAQEAYEKGIYSDEEYLKILKGMKEEFERKKEESNNSFKSNFLRGFMD